MATIKLTNTMSSSLTFKNIWSVRVLERPDILVGC